MVDFFILYICEISYNHRMQNDILKIWTVSDWLRKVGRIESVSEDEKNTYCKIMESLWLFFVSFPSNTITWDYHINFSRFEKLLDSIVSNQIHQSPHTTLKDVQIGALYWYPECCVKKFEQQKHEIANDAMEKESTLYNSKDSLYPFYMNNTTGHRLYFHIACSLDCKETQKLAQRHLFILRKNTPKEEFFEYIEHLKSTYNLAGRNITFQ